MRDFMNNLHPAASGAYFLAVVIFAIMFSHPITLGISFVTAVLSIWYFYGASKLKGIMRFVIRVMVLSVIITPLLLHKGVTIITYLPWGALTREAIYYGFATAFSISSVILWMLFYSEVMTTDKLVYFFGKAAPSVSMVLCIILRLVPNLIDKFREVYAYQKLMQSSSGKTGIIDKTKSLVSVVSIVISWSLDSGVNTAQSIKGRGYGKGKRSSFYRYRMSKEDTVFLITVTSLAAVVIFGAFNGAFKWDYFYRSPKNAVSTFKCLELAALTALYCLPVMFEMSEVKTWKRSN